MICCWRVLLTIDSTSLWQWSLCFVASTLVPFFASEAASFIYLQSGASVSPGWKKTLLLVHSLQFKAFPDSSVNLEATTSHHLHNKVIIPTCHSVSTLDGPDGQKSQGFTKYLLSSNRINSPVTYSRCWTVWVFYFNSDSEDFGFISTSDRWRHLETWITLDKLCDANSCFFFLVYILCCESPECFVWL